MDWFTLFIILCLVAFSTIIGIFVGIFIGTYLEYNRWTEELTKRNLGRMVDYPNKHWEWKND